jgi:hypothetical protein
MLSRYFNHINFIALLVLVTLFLVPLASATGIGPSLQIGDGSGDFSSEEGGCIWGICGDTESDIDQARRWHVGFVIDTAVARDKVFNYRLDFGFGAQNFDLDRDGLISGSLDSKGVTIDNTFGFGVVRNSNVRFWIGPQVHVGFYRGDFEGNQAFLGGGFGETENGDTEYFEFGLGPVAGINVHLDNNITLSFTSGLRWNWFSGDLETKAHYDSGGSFVPSEDFNIHGDSTEIYLNMTVLFRSVDDNM